MAGGVGGGNGGNGGGAGGRGRYEGIIIAGFGGQGILSIGKVIAQAGMDAGMNVSWLPSYGPEMRGGTAYVHVILSDGPIGSPLLNAATVLIAMNQPSMDRYSPLVEDGGVIIADGSMAPEPPKDVGSRRYFALPATDLALDEGNKTFAAVVLAGKLIAATGIIQKEGFEGALRHTLSARYQHLVPKEMEMLEYGMTH
jgi:2-oxoglutarate ferredoxin oxidoreductase subunit gamma